jgi:alpha-L-fucosidase
MLFRDFRGFHFGIQAKVFIHHMYQSVMKSGPMLAIALALGIPAFSSLAADLPNAAPVPDNAMAATDQPGSEPRKAAFHRWNDAKFGLFMHWGVYSVYGGTYKGKELWSAEWIQENARIPYAEYEQTAATWNPSAFDADAWVRLAKDAGMGYIVITARHHDGFAIYPSKASRYNLFTSGAYKGPDPLLALKKACAKYGLLFGIYYSPLEFRSSPKGFDEADEKAIAEGFDYRTLGPQPYASNAEVVALAQAQIKELAEWYKPDILWFDGTWDKMGQWTENDAQEAEKTIRSAVPDVLINNRLGGKSADFNTYENKMPGQPPGGRWEYCWNMGAFWGYNPRNYTPDLIKTPEHYIETLVRIASLGGNYLLNVGPDPTGKFHPMAVDYLTRIGEWVNANGEAVHGTSAGPFKEKPSWGYVTMREGSLYLIVKNLPSTDTSISIPVLKNKIRRAALLAAPDTAIPVSIERKGWVIQNVRNVRSEPFTVIRIDVEGMPEVSQ